MNKVQKLKNILIEAEHKDYSKVLHDGATIHAKDLDGSEAEVDYMIDKNLSFHANTDDIIELHMYDMDSLENFRYKDGLGGWPVAEKQGDHIKLESAYGHGKESYLICKKANVQHGF